MLEILPLEDKVRQQSFCLQCGIDFEPQFMAYAAYRDGKLIGICQFEIASDKAHISSLYTTESDQEALKLLIFATLNFVDVSGIRYARCVSPNIDTRLLISTGFEKIGTGAYEIDLQNLRV